MFRKGDRVRYISEEWGDSEDNPLWGGEHGHIVGTVGEYVSTEEDDLTMGVKWDNGKFNTYTIADLELVRPRNEWKGARITK